MSTNKVTRNLNEVFCENLEFFLKVTSTTQAELARKLNVSRTQVGRILDPKSSPTLDTIEKVAVALSIPPHFLIFIDFEDNDIRRYISWEIDDVDTITDILEALKKFRESKETLQIVRNRKSK